ncbi:hypothetical protein DB347_19510 [Opitutaceae bacterium EW11]|nr:hypothetical protein DB347_19510 [Opitutaceae bacterium EW11]
MKTPFPTKPALSPFVAVAFAVIAVTGVLLFFHVKNGAIMALHECFGWAFVVAGAVHLVLNWRPLVGYLRLKHGRVSLAVALVLTAGLTVLGLTHHHGPEAHPAAGRPTFTDEIRD